MLIAIFVSLLLPLAITYIIWLLDLYSLNQYRLVSASLLWGVVCFGISFIVQRGLLDASILQSEQIVQTAAPLLEEGLKSLWLVLLVLRLRVHTLSDGITYGFATGIGFGIIENLTYVVANPHQPLETAIARVFSATLMHAFTTGMVGAAGGRSTLIGTDARFRHLSLAVLLAVLVHAVFNQLTLRTAGLTLALGAVGIGMGGLGFIWWQIQRDLRAQARDLRHFLGQHLQPGQLEAVINPELVVQKLAQASASMSEERRRAVVDYLAQAARHAQIKRMAEQGAGSRYASTVSEREEAAAYRLEAAHKRLGLYTHIWLRTVLPSSESTVWQALARDVQDEDVALKLVSRLLAREHLVSAAAVQRRSSMFATTSLFSSLDAEELRDLALLVDEVPVSAGDSVIRAGDTSDYLFIVESGAFIASAPGDGEDAIISGYHRGDTFGEHSMLSRTASQENVEAVAPGLVYRLCRTDFMTLIYAHPHIGIALVQQLVAEIHQRTEIIRWMQQTMSPQPN